MTVSLVRPVAVLSVDYPEGPIADAIEVELQQSLPAINGLDSAETEAERLKIYTREVENQRDEFVGMYGDAFGWEKRKVPRDTASQSFGRFFDSVVSAE